MDTKTTFKLGFQQLSKKTYQRATVESRVEKSHNLRKQTRNNLLLQRRNIDMTNFSPYRTPETDTTTKRVTNTIIKPSGANSRLERLKQWKAEREKKRLEEKRKAKPIFKVCHVPTSIGWPNYENVNKEIKRKPILKSMVCQKTTKRPTVLKREDTFTIDNNGHIQHAEEAKVKPDDERKENAQQKEEQRDEIKPSEEETRPAAKTKKVELSEAEPVTSKKTPRLRRQSRLDSCISSEPTPERSARKSKSEKAIRRTPHPKFNRNNSQEKASEKSLDEKENDALNETYSIEELNRKVEKGPVLQETFGEAFEKKKRFKTSRSGRNIGNKIEPLNDENDSGRREDMQQLSVVKTPRKSRKNEKTPKRIIESQIIDDQQYSITKTSLRKSSVKKRPNAEETTNKTTKNQNSSKIIKETEDIDIKQNDFPKESKRKSSAKKLFNLEHHDSSTPNKLKQNQEKINEAEMKKSKRKSTARKSEIPQSKNSALLTPSKIPRYSLIETPKTNTPSKNSVPVVYVSPFVTISRGGYSARKEFKARSSTGGTLPGREETSVAAGANYFTELLQEETNLIEKIIEEWRIYTENNMPDGAEDMINAALGQSHLLLTKKFKQFKQLIEKCKHQDNKEPSITCTDLHGYWDTMYIQIDDIKKRFEYLEKLRSNNWIEILPEIKNAKITAKVNKKKGKKPQVSSKIKDMIKKERLKKRDLIQKRLSNVTTTPSTPEIMMRVSQRIKQGDGITPNRSILKTDDTKFERRMAKNVLFDLTNTKMNLNDEDKNNLLKINNDECETYVGTPLRRSQRLSHMKKI